MSLRFTRLIALIALLGTGFYVCGVPLALAAAGSVRGRVTVPGGGTLPPGSIVRATPRGGGATFSSDPIKADGTYQIPQLPQGAYVFEIVGPDGRVLGSATTMVAPMPVTVNLVASVPSAGPAPTPTPSPGPTPAATPAPTPTPSPAGPNKKQWITLGTILGGLGIGAAIGSGGDSNGSPSQP